MEAAEGAGGGEGRGEAERDEGGGGENERRLEEEAAGGGGESGGEFHALGSLPYLRPLANRSDGRRLIQRPGGERAGCTLVTEK